VSPRLKICSGIAAHRSVIKQMSRKKATANGFKTDSGRDVRRAPARSQKGSALRPIRKTVEFSVTDVAKRIPLGTHFYAGGLTSESPKIQPSEAIKNA
jgi:hypothetical protein